MHRSSYDENPALLDGVLQLVADVFSGLEVLDQAQQLGLDWAAVSTPFVAFDGGRVVSHVGVLSFPLVVEGRESIVGGIHSVCTRPDYRGRGLFRSVMAEAADWCAVQFETTMLFTERPQLYETFGFRVIKETSFLLEASSAEPSVSSDLRMLDWSNEADVALLHRIARERTPVSCTFGIGIAPAAFIFNAIHLPMWHSAELDAIISYKETDETLRIFDVAARTMPDWKALEQCLPVAGKSIEFCFCPDRLGIKDPIIHKADPFDDFIMARGPLGCDLQQRTFPRTAEF